MVLYSFCAVQPEDVNLSESLQGGFHFSKRHWINFCKHRHWRTFQLAQHVVTIYDLMYYGLMSIILPIKIIVIKIFKSGCMMRSYVCVLGTSFSVGVQQLVISAVFFFSRDIPLWVVDPVDPNSVYVHWVQGKAEEALPSLVQLL